MVYQSFIMNTFIYEATSITLHHTSPLKPFKVKKTRETLIDSRGDGSTKLGSPTYTETNTPPKCVDTTCNQG